MKTVLAAIAKKCLFIDTLETRNSDSLDFHDNSVGCISAALEAAYKAGQESTAKLPVDNSNHYETSFEFTSDLETVAGIIKSDKFANWMEETDTHYFDDNRCESALSVVRKSFSELKTLIYSCDE